jgi:hypothetical protein
MPRRLIFWTDGPSYQWMVMDLGVSPTQWDILDRGTVHKARVRHSPIADGIKLAYTGMRRATINTCTTVARYTASSRPHRRLWLRNTGWKS